MNKEKEKLEYYIQNFKQTKAEFEKKANSINTNYARFNNEYNRFTLERDIFNYDKQLFLSMNIVGNSSTKLSEPDPKSLIKSSIKPNISTKHLNPAKTKEIIIERPNGVNRKDKFDILSRRDSHSSNKGSMDKVKPDAHNTSANVSI